MKLAQLQSNEATLKAGYSAIWTVCFEVQYFEAKQLTLTIHTHTTQKAK